jgi:hypothetical protein
LVLISKLSVLPVTAIRVLALIDGLSGWLPRKAVRCRPVKREKDTGQQAAVMIKIITRTNGYARRPARLFEGDKCYDKVRIGEPGPAASISLDAAGLWQAVQL